MTDPTQNTPEVTESDTPPVETVEIPHIDAPEVIVPITPSEEVAPEIISAEAPITHEEQPSVSFIPLPSLTAAQVSAIQYLTGDFSEPLSLIYVGKQCYDDGTLGSADAAPISAGLAMMVGSRNEERLGMRRDVACGVMLNRADFA